MDLIILPRAEEEIEEGRNFYNDKKANLGEEFLAELHFYFAAILKLPTTFKKNNLGFREASLKRFPFLIIFEINKNTIFVYSVFHTSRDPLKKPRP